MSVTFLVLFMHFVALLQFTPIVCVNYFNFVPGDVHFEFYPKGDLKNFETIKILNDKNEVQIPDDFDGTKQTFVYIHGYLSMEKYVRAQAKMFFDNMGTECCNFLALNWINGANNIYYWHVRKRMLLVKRIFINFVEFFWLICIVCVIYYCRETCAISCTVTCIRSAVYEKVVFKAN